MKHTERNCFVASTVTHSLLAALVFVGSGFLPTPPPAPPADSPIVMFIPSTAIITDSKTQGGGNPKADPNQTPAPLPPPPPDKVPVVVPPMPRPVPPAPQPVKPAPKAPEPEPDEDKSDAPDPTPVAKKPAPPKPKTLNTNFTTRVNTQRQQRETARQEAEERQERKEREDYANKQLAWNRSRNQLLTTIHGVADGISKGMSTTAVETYGPGGQAFINYRDYVKTVYEARWTPPDEASDESTVVVAKITVARDGTVLNASVLTSSGNPILDRSVQRVLNTVKDIGQSFPAAAKDAQRSFKIKFDLKAKKGLG